MTKMTLVKRTSPAPGTDDNLPQQWGRKNNTQLLK